MPEAQHGQHDQQTPSYETADGRVARDGAHGAEGVAVEQEPTEGAAHEQRLPQLAERGDLLGVGVRVLGHRHELAADLLVRPTVAGRVHVRQDVVVGEGLGLRTGVHRTAGERLEGLTIFLRERRQRVTLRHDDVLHHQLVVDLPVDEVGGPQAQPTARQQHDSQDEADAADESVYERTHGPAPLHLT